MSGCGRSETAVFVNVRYKNEFDTSRDALYNPPTSKSACKARFQFASAQTYTSSRHLPALHAGVVSVASITRALIVAQRRRDSVQHKSKEAPIVPLVLLAL